MFSPHSNGMSLNNEGRRHGMAQGRHVPGGSAADRDRVTAGLSA